MTFRVEASNKFKKSFEEIEYFVNDELNVSVAVRTGWRYGTVRFDIEDWDELDNYESDDYELEVSNMDEFEFIGCYDGCWTDIEVFSKGDMQEDELEALREKITVAYDEDGFDGLVENGFESDDYEAWIWGPMEVEKVENPSEYI